MPHENLTTKVSAKVVTLAGGTQQEKDILPHAVAAERYQRKTMLLALSDCRVN